jgi:hypothetical protein
MSAIVLCDPGVANKTSSMHDARTIIGGASGQVHQCTVVPKHNIKWFPFVSINVSGVSSVLKQKLQKFLTLFFGQAINPGSKMWIYP